METVRIKSIFVNEANKDGQPYVDKRGNKYKRVKLVLEDGRSPSALAYGSEAFLSWKSGDEVEVVIEQNGDFLNFSLPEETDMLEERLKVLEDWKGKVGPFLNIVNEIMKEQINDYKDEKLSKESL